MGFPRVGTRVFFSRFLSETRLEPAMENSDAGQDKRALVPRVPTCVVRISYGKSEIEIEANKMLGEVLAIVLSSSGDAFL